MTFLVRISSQWPMRIWLHRKHVTIEAGEDKVLAQAGRLRQPCGLAMPAIELLRNFVNLKPKLFAMLAQRISNADEEGFQIP